MVSKEEDRKQVHLATCSPVALLCIRQDCWISDPCFTSVDGVWLPFISVLIERSFSAIAPRDLLS